MEKEIIKTRTQLKEWLALDAVHYTTQIQSFWKRLKYNLLAHPCMDQYYTWKYVKTLRYAEYHSNNTSLLNKILRTKYLYMLKRLGYKTGFQIPPNVVGPGLNLPHYGVIIINDKCKIGRNSTLYSGVCIGWKKRGMACPRIGDDVFVGMGTNIIGDVQIGNDVVIGQNCVIVKNIPSGSIVVVHSPRIIN